MQPGQDLIVNYTADDTLYSSYLGGIPSQSIDSIRYSFDKPSWISGSGARTIVLRTQVPKYTSTFTASTTGLTSGQHTLFVESLDGSGAWGPPTAIFFTISNGQPPVALPDAYTTDEDVELVVAAAEGVLANDTDDGPITAVLETDVANGTLALAVDGSFTYMPDTGFFGEDVFTYKAFDGGLYSAAATVTITVNEVISEVFTIYIPMVLK